MPRKLNKRKKVQAERRKMIAAATHKAPSMRLAKPGLSLGALEYLAQLDALDRVYRAVRGPK